MLLLSSSSRSRFKVHQRRYSLKSKISLVFIVYIALQAATELLVNQLSPDHHPDDIQPRNRHRHHQPSTTGPTIDNGLINGSLSLESRDNDDDDDRSSANGYKSRGRAKSLSSSGLHWLASQLNNRWPMGSGSGSALLMAQAIRLVRLDAPNFLEAGQPMRLRCIYETRGDKLQSLSWYKNGREFYRYQPFERRQPILAFDYTGVTVDLTKSRNSTVVLTNTTMESSGRYKCEATATTFQEVNLETYVTVVAPTTDGSPAVMSPSQGGSMLLLVMLMLIATLMA